MNEFTITGEPREIVIGATGTDEILQNVRIILTTVKGTVPLDRSFGIETDFTDKPLPVAKALLTAAIIEEVERQEPRVKIRRLDFIDNSETGAADGILIPRLVLTIKESAL